MINYKQIFYLISALWIMSAIVFATTTISDTSSTFTGNLAVDTNTLYVDGANNRVGIGTTSPDQLLSIVKQADDYSIISNTLYDDTITKFPTLIFYTINGTQSSPSPTITNQYLGVLGFGGYDTDKSTGASIYAKAPANWGTGGDASDSPANMYFTTTPDGSGSPIDRMIITSTGNVGIGTTSPASILHIDKGTGFGGVTVDGSSGACLMLRDTDDAGWTKCTVLNGVMTCVIDADGVC